MIERILAFWFGFILSYCGIDIILHGLYSFSWKFHNPLVQKVLAIVNLILGVYLIIYALTPKTAIKISKKIFKRKDV